MHGSIRPVPHIALTAPAINSISHSCVFLHYLTESKENQKYISKFLMNTMFDIETPMVYDIRDLLQK
jgi:hypothetical protein